MYLIMEYNIINYATYVTYIGKQGTNNMQITFLKTIIKC